MKMSKIKKTICTIFTLLGIVSLFAMYWNGQKSIPLKIEVLQLDIPQKFTSKPSVPPEIALTSTSQVNPDGTYDLTLNARHENDSVAYALHYSQNDLDTKNSLFETTLTGDGQLSIPFNTWSPDNKYVFLKQTQQLDRDYLVFPVSNVGVTSPIRIRELFAAKYPDYLIKEITGWAAPGLLIINSVTVNGESGPSFWFAPSSLSFTRLSTKF